MTATIAAWGPWAYAVLFAVSAGESSAFLGLVVPGEAFVVLAGALIARGALAWTPVLAAVVLGAIVGDTIGYTLGHHFGGCRDRGWLSRVWSCDRTARVRDFLDRHGASTIFAARFVGVLRPLAPFAAGAVSMRYRAFVVYNVLGALVWSGSAIALGYAFGEPAERVLRAGGFAPVLLAAVAVVALRATRRRRRGSRDLDAPRAPAAVDGRPDDDDYAGGKMAICVSKQSPIGFSDV